MAKRKSKDNISAGDNSIVVGGNVQGSNIVVGNNNRVGNTTINLSMLFDEIHRKLDADKTIEPETKKEVRADLKEMQAELEKPEPDESFLARRVRNIRKMAPDIADIALETLKNPISGVVEVIKKVAKKAAEEAGA